MKYYVSFRIDARYVTGVEADSVEEAISKANENYMDEDFGAASDIRV